jgi:hypothetical protein
MVSHGDLSQQIRAVDSKIKHGAEEHPPLFVTAIQHYGQSTHLELKLYPAQALLE